MGNLYNGLVKNKLVRIKKKKFSGGRIPNIWAKSYENFVLTEQGYSRRKLKMTIF